MITQENGTYRWTGTVDALFDRKVYSIVFGVVGGMCVFFLIMALIVNPEMLLITLLSDLGVMAVVSLITIPYMKASRGRQQAYEMNDEFIHYVGYGKEKQSESQKLAGNEEQRYTERRRYHEGFHYLF